MLPTSHPRGESRGDPRNPLPAAGRDGPPPRRLLRDAHIFASLVEEILEERALAEVSHHPLSRSQLHLLKLLRLDGQPQIGETARLLGVSDAAASKTVDKLVRLGLARRLHIEGDRRGRRVALSPTGRQLVRDCEAREAARLTPVRDEFTAAELRRFAADLERFCRCLLRQESLEDNLCLRCAAYFAEDCPVAATRQEGSGHDDGCPHLPLRRAAAEAAARNQRPWEGETC